jgi:hypothetical protein
MDPMSSPVHGDLGMKKKTGRRKIKVIYFPPLA